jgi:two-component system response regulator HydG
MSDVRGEALSGGRGRVFVVDDDPDVCGFLEARLTGCGFGVRWMGSPEVALEHLATADVDAVVTDVKMAELNGLDLCERLVRRRPDIPVIVMTAFGTIETAIAAIRRGAYDFITKPIAVDTLVVALDRAMEHRALRAEVERLQRAVEEAGRLEGLVGESVPMRRLHQLLDRAAPSDTTVLVTGESGTGKDLVAHELHRRSPRAAGPFVAINCGAIPAALLESELFGHTRGAFTDAQRARPGLVREASGGTLFLDEMVELPRPLQAKLLRVLQERSVRPVGGEEEVSVDVRVVAATNQDPEIAVRDGCLRKDLYFRLNVIRIELPPLRARGTDVLVLAQHFVNQYGARARKRVSGVSAAAAKRLLAYAWPGNVRELQNCIERGVALTETDRIGVQDLPDAVREPSPAQVALASANGARLETLSEVERRHILRVMESVAGHRRTAARILGLDRKTLYRKLARYGVKAQSREP